MPLDERQTFLRWAGGKRRLVRRLRGFVPLDVRDRVYHEPFLGAASIFLALRPRKAYLADLNPALVNAFQHVRDNPHLIARYLADHAERDSQDYYYVVRTTYNKTQAPSYAQTARFIYLNRTCFNGIFRVTRVGNFNVPYGRLKNPMFPSTRHLREVSKALRRAELRTASYRESCQRAKQGHFVYLDPPYPPLNGTSFFRHYTPALFSDADQRELFKEVRALDARGCLFLMSNADTPLIRELYRAFNIVTLPVTRWVSSKNSKHAVTELVITNYLSPQHGQNREQR